MAKKSLRFAILLTVLSYLAVLATFAQEPTQAAPAQAAPAKPTFMSPSQRLVSAKTAYTKNAGGSTVPFDVINGALEGWGRFIMVESPDKADLLVEVTSPEDTKATSSKNSHISTTGQPEESTTTTRDLSTQRVKMVVSDGKTHIVLWAGSEQPKSAMKQRSWNDNLVDAAQRLVQKFHDRVEPPAAK